ncbi:hypothetical protein QQG91_09755 [Marivivens sp. LCG002]|uniref:hypothetical protein n=1 Tax=Marivivens sp. LCG002 TaxID=3051171 RepID=UPI0025523CDC|nr:hypothetical protein [Marivivens sp. LCG002]WIV49956.1 hypothetical protein QQG91_09755 [Marivivens sp. LCG002]
MYSRIICLAAALPLFAAGCTATNPLADDLASLLNTGGEPSANGDSDGITISGTTLSPATTNANGVEQIIRYEASDSGFGGLSRGFTYVSVNDTIVIDNIAFDGGNVYTRGNPVSQVNNYAVYEGDATALDPLTGKTIPQVTNYRALIGFSTNRVDGAPRSAFAINRTGGYVQYGFGGFVYQRVGGVTMPTSGQAVFEGDYAGMRVFDTRGGLEFTEGDIQLVVDFNDFNSGATINGEITNRRAFDIDGNLITLGGTGNLVLPDLRITVAKDDVGIAANGEVSGTIGSVSISTGGAAQAYETGKYYAILSGDATSAADGGEIVGIVVVESTDPRFTGVKAQETGGFIAYR